MAEIRAPRALAAAVLALVLVHLASLLPAAAGSPVPGIRLWVEVVRNGPEIRPQEMVILRFHGRFQVPVTLERLDDPKGTDFRLVRVGRDIWSDVFEEGLTIRAVERTVAVFPQRSGRTVIPPFVHHLTILDAAMKTQKIDVTTDETVLDVAPAPAPPDTWWLPATSLSIADEWTVPPERLAIGQSTRRTLTLTVGGVFDDQIPPAPPIKADGLIVFPGVAARETFIGLGKVKPESELALRDRSLRRPGRYKELKDTPEGPLARVAYSWDIRPRTDAPVVLPEIRIPWFDVRAGRMRTVVVPARTVALAPEDTTPDVAALEAALGIGAPPPPRGADLLGPVLAAAGAVVAFLLALGGGIAVVSPGTVAALRRRRAEAGARRALARELGRAARARDGAAVRSVVTRLAAAGRLDPERVPEVGVLDRHLHAARPGPEPDWPRLAAAVLAAVRPSSLARTEPGGRPVGPLQRA